MRAKAAPSDEIVVDAIEIFRRDGRSRRGRRYAEALSGFAINVGAPAKPAATKHPLRPPRKRLPPPPLSGTADEVGEATAEAIAPAPAKSKLPLILVVSIGGGVLARCRRSSAWCSCSAAATNGIKRIASANVTKGGDSAPDDAEKPARQSRRQSQSEPESFTEPVSQSHPLRESADSGKHESVPPVNPAAILRRLNRRLPIRRPQSPRLPSRRRDEARTSAGSQTRARAAKDKPKGNRLKVSRSSFPCLRWDRREPCREALQEMKFGPAKLAGLDCFVDLFGGDGAFKGKQRFTLEPGNGGTSTTDWDISSAGG